MNIGKRREENSPVILTPVQGGTGKDAYIGSGTVIKGTLTFANAAELNASIEGEILAKDRLRIGEGAVITARIIGTDIEIAGTVTGDVIASGKLVLRKPARITGNIVTSSLTIEDGVTFEGSCTMKESSQKNSSQLGISKV